MHILSIIIAISVPVQINELYVLNCYLCCTVCICSDDQGN